MGSWVTFLLVRLPRLGMSIFSAKFFHRVVTVDRKIKFLDWEWKVRAITVALYIVLSLGFSVWLPGQFCKLFSGIFFQLGRTASQAMACKWQVFGFRLVFMVLYFPVDIILFCVTYRHTRDLTFQIQLKEAIYLGETELQNLSMAVKNKGDPFKAVNYIRKGGPDQRVMGGGLDEEHSINYDHNMSQRRFLNEDFSMRQGGQAGANQESGFLPPISG